MRDRIPLLRTLSLGLGGLALVCGAHALAQVSPRGPGPESTSTSPGTPASPSPCAGVVGTSVDCPNGSTTASPYPPQRALAPNPTSTSPGAVAPMPAVPIADPSPVLPSGAAPNTTTTIQPPRPATVVPTTPAPATPANAPAAKPGASVAPGSSVTR